MSLLYYDRPARSTVYSIMTDQLDLLSLCLYYIMTDQPYLLSLLYYDRPARSIVSIIIWQTS
jgi:hypothetical protein